MGMLGNLSVRMRSKHFAYFIFLVSLLFSACVKNRGGSQDSTDISSVVQPGGVLGPGPKEGTAEGISGRKIVSALFTSAPTIKRINQNYEVQGRGISFPEGKTATDYEVHFKGLSQSQLEELQLLSLGTVKDLTGLGESAGQSALQPDGSFSATVSIPRTEILLIYLAETGHENNLAIPSDLAIGFFSPALSSDLRNPDYPSVPEEVVQNPNEGPEAFTPINVLTSLYVTPLGTHNDAIAGVSPGPGYSILGGFTDLGSWIAEGNQIFWGKKSMITASNETISVILDIMVTTPGQHIPGGPALPQGFVSVGLVKDAVGFDWGGEQKIALLGVPFNSVPSGTRVLSDIYVTPPGLRNMITGCSAGYELFGYTSDCQYGSCWGYQSFCAAYITK